MAPATSRLRQSVASRCAPVVILLSALAGNAISAPQVLRHALARITAYAPGGVNSGTGFLVRSGYVITAYHVVVGARRIDIVLGDGAPAKDVVVVAVRPEADLAVLKAPPGYADAGYFTEEIPGGAPGSEIYVHGLPLGFDAQLLVGRLTQSGSLPSQKWIDRNGRSLFAVRDIDVVPLDITSEPGLSGAPVLDARGRAFGVFSGSLQAGGGGYAWAVPLAYVRIPQMQQIGLPASAIGQWPTFTYLHPSLSLLRSLKQDSTAARLAASCRAAIEDFRRGWAAQLDAAHHYQLRWSLFKPGYDSIRQASKGQSIQSQIDRLRLLWEQIEPQATAFKASQNGFEKSGAHLLTACYSQALLDSLMQTDAPATRSNVLFGQKLSRRIDQLVESNERARVAFAAFAAKTQAQLGEALDIGTARDQSEAQVLDGMLRAMALAEGGVTGVLSHEQAQYIASLDRGALAWAEILEAQELHAWEHEFQTLAYLDLSGVHVTLSNGWIEFDGEVQDALLARKGSLPSVRFVVLKSSLDPTPPRAMAELSWRTASAPPPAGTDQSRQYWALFDADWRALEQREGTNFANASRSSRRIGPNLVLEATGNGRLANGTTFKAYLAHHVGASGTARLTCLLLAPQVDYAMCTQISDSMRLPY